MRRPRERRAEADSRPPRSSPPRQHSTSTTSQIDSLQADDAIQRHANSFLQKTRELLGPQNSKEFLSLFRRLCATQKASDRHKVVRHGRELLEDHKSLLLFFNIFLPVQDRMTMPQLVEYRNKNKYFLRKVRTCTNLAVYIQCATILGMTEQDKMSATDAQEQLSSVLKDQLNSDLKKEISCLYLPTNPSYVLRAASTSSSEGIAVVNHALRTNKGNNGRVRNNADELAIFGCEGQQFEKDGLLRRLVATIDRVGAYLAARVLINIAGNEHKSSCPAFLAALVLINMVGNEQRFSNPPSNEMFLAPIELECIKGTCNENLLESIKPSAVRDMYSSDKLEEIHKRLLQEHARLTEGGVKLQRKWWKLYLHNNEGTLGHLRNAL